MKKERRFQASRDACALAPSLASLIKTVNLDHRGSLLIEFHCWMFILARVKFNFRTNKLGPSTIELGRRKSVNCKVQPNH